MTMVERWLAMCSGVLRISDFGSSLEQSVSSVCMVRRLVGQRYRQTGVSISGVGVSLLHWERVYSVRLHVFGL